MLKEETSGIEVIYTDLTLMLMSNFRIIMNDSRALCWTLATFGTSIYTVGRIPWTGDQPVAWPLSTHRTTQTLNIHTQTSVPRVGFKPTTPVFDQAKTVHALDRAAAVISLSFH
jgi:hypothetical protein